MIVNVRQGSLSGNRHVTILGKKPYLCFSGIPYAMAPTGDLRFQPPRPIFHWEGVYNATHERGPAVQKSPLLKTIIGSEDCLYLNVYAPEVRAHGINALKAVMVFIHGGSFCTGSGTKAIYGPDFLLDHDVIVVTINYRLQMLGFLNLGIPECPGNVGLKDQMMALQWVKDNIINFGGDPNNITLFGESAGASSAHFLAISPLSRGLFHKVILQSGFCLASWSLTPNPVEIAFDLGRRLGYFGTDRIELLNHLKRQPAKDLIRIGNQLKNEISETFDRNSSIFSPSMELIREGAIIPDHPGILLRTSPPLPMIIGCTDLEGLLGIGSMSKKGLEIVSNDVSILLMKYFNIDPNHLPEKTAQIMSHYFHDPYNQKAKLQSLANLITDIYFYNLDDTLDYLSGTIYPPYVYEFCYTGKMNGMKKFFSMKIRHELKGACHGDDINYLFHHKNILPKRGFHQDDLTVVEKMCRNWTHFAKFGTPLNQKWQPYTKYHPCHLKIDTKMHNVNGPLRGARPQILRNILGPYSMKNLAT